MGHSQFQPSTQINKRSCPYDVDRAGVVSLPHRNRFLSASKAKQAPVTITPLMAFVSLENRTRLRIF